MQDDIGNADGHLVLRRPKRLTPWQSIALRAGLALVLVGFALGVHWFDRDGLRDNSDGVISFIDVLYFTAITITTVGYGDIVPVTQQARLFDAVVVTPIRLFVWLIFLGTAYSFVFRRSWERWRTKMIERTLTGHVIVCGFGASGSATVAELLRKGHSPDRVVVIDPDAERVAAAVRCGVLALQGDASRNASLAAARIEAADAVIVSPGRDDTTALIVLTSRQLNPSVRISASVRNEENEDLVRQAGASTVINPVNFGGHLLAQSIDGSLAVDYIHDLATAGGEVFIRERPVSLGEVGRRLKDVTTGVGLRVHRGSTVYSFWEDPALLLEAGDMIVEIVSARSKTSSGPA